LSSLRATIRKAVPADVPAVIALEQASAGAAHWTESEYSSIFSPKGVRRVLCVAESAAGDDASVVGFVLARVVANEWEIENIVVDGASQRRGIGRALVSAVIEQARLESGSRMFLEVRRSNAAAISLYMLMSFHQDGIRRSYYKDPEEDALLFSRSLENSS